MYLSGQSPGAPGVAGSSPAMLHNSGIEKLDTHRSSKPDYGGSNPPPATNI